MALDEQVIGAAIIEVKADLDRLSKDFKKAQSTAKASSTKIAKETSRIGAAAATAGKRILQIGAAYATIRGGMQLVAMVKQSLAFADSIAKTADKLGVSTDALQEFRFAAEQAGVAQTTLDMGLQRFIRRFQEAQAGVGEAKDALAELEIKLIDTAGNARRGEDAFADAMEALAGVDVTKRLRLAFKLFDSEGVALVNLANNFEEMRIAARSAGVIIEESTIRSAEDAKNTLDALGASIKKELTESLVTLAPFLVQATKFMRGLAIELGNVFRRIQDVTKLGLNDLKEQLAENEVALAAVTAEAEKFRGTLADIAQGASREFEIARLNEANAQLRELIKNKETEQALDISRLRRNQSEVTNFLQVQKDAKAEAKELGAALRRSIDFGREGVDELGNDITTEFEGVGAQTEQIFEGAFSNMVLTGENAAKAIGDALIRELVGRGVGVGVASLLNALSSLGGLFGPQTTTLPATGGPAAGIAPGIAAHGGFQRGLTVVGERGPELVDVGPNAHVTSSAALRNAVGGGGGVGASVVVNVQNFGKDPVEVQKGFGSDGVAQIDIIVARAAATDIRRGGIIAQEINARFGSKRIGGAR